MVTFNKKDLQAVFTLLAVVYFLDSLGSGFVVPLGIVVTAIILGLVWLSTSDSGKSVQNALKSFQAEPVLRIAVAVVLVGILLLDARILAVGILIGTILLFSQKDTLEIEDLLTFKVKVGKGVGAKSRK